MYTDEQFEELEQKERAVTDVAIAIMLVRLGEVHVALEKELRSFYQKYGTDGVVTYLQSRKWVSNEDHRRRLTALYSFMLSQFDDALTDLTDAFESFVKDVIAKESEFFDTDFNNNISLKWGEDDLDWYERLIDDVVLWTTRLRNDWKRSFLQNKHIDDVLDQLDERFDSIFNVIERLALTESTAVGSIARREIFKALGFSKYRYYAKADERVCDVCGSMHGLTFPMSAYEVGVTASPMHPRCRCWEVPIAD